MSFDILALPREMIAEIVKYVDYNGLLTLRKTCKSTKTIVDEICKAPSIRLLGFWHDKNNAYLRILLNKSKPPLFLKDIRHLIDRSLEYKKQNLLVKVPVDQFPNFLEQFLLIISRCWIHVFLFDSRDDAYISLMSSFLRELRVIDKCLIAYGFSDWNTAISTVKLMHLNKARMDGHSLIEDQLKMADVVDSLVLDIYFSRSAMEIVSQILKLYSKRCNSIHWTGLLTADQVDVLVKALSALEKQVYFFSKVEESVVKRKRTTVGSLYIEIGYDEIGYSFFEVSYPGCN